MAQNDARMLVVSCPVPRHCGLSVVEAVSHLAPDDALKKIEIVRLSSKFYSKFEISTYGSI